MITPDSCICKIMSLFYSFINDRCWSYLYSVYNLPWWLEVIYISLLVYLFLLSIYIQYCLYDFSNRKILLRSWMIKFNNVELIFLLLLQQYQTCWLIYITNYLDKLFFFNFFWLKKHSWSDSYDIELPLLIACEDWG